jgi:hypothetical protein
MPGGISGHVSDHRSRGRDLAPLPGETNFWEREHRLGLNASNKGEYMGSVVKEVPSGVSEKAGLFQASASRYITYLFILLPALILLLAACGGGGGGGGGGT